MAVKILLNRALIIIKGKAGIKAGSSTCSAKWIKGLLSESSWGECEDMSFFTTAEALAETNTDFSNHSSDQMHLTPRNCVEIKQKASVQSTHARAIWTTHWPDLWPAVSTLSPCRHFSSWNRAHMTEHNIHSNNYPQRDDVTCLFNFVWTGVRLILSLIVPQPCPFKESLLSFGSRGTRGNPIMVIDWWLRSNTWSTHTGSGHIHILTGRNAGRKSPQLSAWQTAEIKYHMLHTLIRTSVHFSGFCLWFFFPLSVFYISIQ